MTALIEDAKEIVVDQWGTLNTAASPHKLPIGHSPNNQNVWMDEKPGSVITANGYTKLGEIPSGNPPTFLLNFFRTADGTYSLIASDGRTIWTTTDYVNYTTIKTGLSPFFQLRGTVIRDKVWLTNGSDPVMTWNGTTLVTLDGTSSTPNVPKGKYIAFHEERVWMFGIDGDLSALRFSALANSSGTEIAPDSASAWPTDNEIQVSEGDADVGTGIFLYRSYLYCSKQYSIWRIVGDDEYSYTRVKTRSSTGTRFQESIQSLDNLIHFIGVDGMYVFDGEDSKRISDIIDPASSDVGVFAFRNLQQPLLNNQFWNVSETADWNSGTVPNVLSTAGDQLTLVPADDSQADFAGGTTLTNIDTSEVPGAIRLSHTGTGRSSQNLASGQAAICTPPSGQSLIGSEFRLTDGDTANGCGFTGSGGQLGTFRIPVSSTTIQIGTIVLRSYIGNGSIMHVSAGGGPFKTILSVTSPAAVTTHLGFSAIQFPADSIPRDYTITITAVAVTAGTYVVLSVYAISSSVTLTEIEVYATAYNLTGQYISAPIDYGAAPPNYGVICGTIDATEGGTYQFFTQSSNDGSSWDAAVTYVGNNQPIGSTLRRYLRWGVNFTSTSGLQTPQISQVVVGGTYISQVFDTGGNIFQWGAFQMSQNKAGQVITAYFRAAATEIGVASEPWTTIVPGAIPNTAVTNRYIQIRLYLATATTLQLPYVESFTINWILSTGTGVNTLQNVASFVWLNRYWLSAATLGAEENDIVIVRGKLTAGSPWHKKDFSLLSFCRFQDYFIGGSSEDGSIYRLEYGYSKNGDALDSYFETADYSDSGFMIKGYEILATVDRSGPYTLSVGFSTDGGITYTDKDVDLTRESGASLSYDKRLNVRFMSETVRLRVRTNAADQPFSVDELQLYYRVTPQRGSIS